MQAGAAPANEGGDRRVGRGGLEQFERGRAGVEHVRADALRDHLFGYVDFETEGVAIERQRFVEPLDGNPDMVEDGLHIDPPRTATPRATSARAAAYGSIRRAATSAAACAKASAGSACSKRATSSPTASARMRACARARRRASRIAAERSRNRHSVSHSSGTPRPAVASVFSTGGV